MAKKKGSAAQQNGAPERLLDQASGHFLFTGADKSPNAIIEDGGIKKTFPVRSLDYRLVLSKTYYDFYGEVAGDAAMDAAIRHIEAKALFDGPEIETNLRVGPYGDGGVAIDLCDESWEAVIVDAGVVRVGVPQKPFVRNDGMSALPRPVKGGNVNTLREMGHVQDDASWLLLLAALLCMLMPGIPYPILLILGLAGTAKSTLTKMLRELIDPSPLSLSSLPKSVRDLMLSARNSHLLAFDNLGTLSPAMSDALCQIVTGGGIRARKLYTDFGEAIIRAKCALVLNGIVCVATANDLLDRAVVIRASEIPPSARLPEAKLWARFYGERPRILGALYELLAQVLEIMKTHEISEAERMADYCRVGVALEIALELPPGTFMAAYGKNRDEAITEAIEGDPVIDALLLLLRREGGWQGTASQLFERLAKMVNHRRRPLENWPPDPRTLSARLRRETRGLAALGFAVKFDQSVAGQKRVIVIAPADMDERTSDAYPPTDCIPEGPGIPAKSFCDDGEPSTNRPGEETFDLLKLRLR